MPESTARRFSDGALALATSGGLIGATMVGLYARGLWKIGLACATLVAFGAVGIFDRSEIRPRWLSLALRTASVIVAGALAFALLYVALEFALANLKP